MLANLTLRARLAGGRGGGGFLDGTRLSLIDLPLVFTMLRRIMAGPLKHDGLQLLLNLF